MQSGLMLKVLLNRYHQSTSHSLLRGLPPEGGIDDVGRDAGKALTYDVTSGDVMALLTFPNDLLEAIHYSWLVAPIQRCPAPLQPYIVAALPKEKSVQLYQLLGIKRPQSLKLSSLMKRYLLQFLYDQLVDRQVLPLAFLPSSPFAPMLEMDKRILVEMIDYLAIYDLANRLRQIVDKQKQESILNCLSPAKRKFLFATMQKVDKVPLPLFDLSSWTGEAQHLNVLLHRRGLLRLGKALAGQHPDFVWHLCRHFDTGRGASIERYYSKEQVPGVTSLLAEQTLSIMNTINLKSRKS